MLGVVISETQPTSVSLDKHVINVGATLFYDLRRLRHIRRTLSKESAATLVHAFATSRVDYRNVVFAGAPKLQRVFNVAARVVSEPMKPCVYQLHQAAARGRTSGYH